MADGLERRRNALEETFFGKRDHDLLEQMRAKLSQDKHRESLTAASGITDPAVLDLLIANGIESTTLAAVSLAPLVLVAWADGSVKPTERDAVLKAAADSGVKEGDPSSQLLEGWLNERPESELLDTWAEYIQELKSRLDEKAREAVKSDIVGRAQTVAEAAGGFMGIGSVSKEEKAVIEAIKKAFD